MEQLHTRYRYHQNPARVSTPRNMMMMMDDPISPSAPTNSTPEDSPVSTPSQGESAKSSKRQEQLKRVSLACEQCRSRKIKCNGKNPCDQCISHHRLCHRAAGRKPRDRGLKDKQINHLESRIKELERYLSAHFKKGADTAEQASESATPAQLMTPKSISPSSGAGTLQTNGLQTNGFKLGSPTNTNYTLLKSTKGQYKYIGSASALSLAYQLQRVTIEDVEGPAFPQYDLDDTDFDCNKPFRHAILPPRSVSDKLVDCFFATINKTFPFFEEEEYRKMLNDTFNREIYETPIWTATYLNVYALGAWQLEKNRSRNWRDLPGYKYFDSAVGLMDTILKEATPEAMRVSLLVVIYLMGVAKVSVSYTILGVATRTLQSMGAHRETNAADSDLRRRVFYICYVLEKSLTFTLGRPSAIQDFDCDVVKPNRRSDAPVDIFVENIELTRIAGLIHQRLYCAQAIVELAKLPIADVTARGNELVGELEHWRAELPPAYRTGAPNMPTEIIPLYLNYYNLLISIHRSHADMASCGRNCVVEPARELITLIRDTKHIVDSGCWLEMYHVFAAAAVLYKYMLKDVARPSAPDLSFMLLVQDSLRKCTGFVMTGQYLSEIIGRWNDSLISKQYGGANGSSSMSNYSDPQPQMHAMPIEFTPPLQQQQEQPNGCAGMSAPTMINPGSLEVSYEFGEFTVPAWLDMGQQMDWINWDLNIGV